MHLNKILDRTTGWGEIVLTTTHNESAKVRILRRDRRTIYFCYLNGDGNGVMATDQIKRLVSGHTILWEK